MIRHEDKKSLKMLDNKFFNKGNIDKEDDIEYGIVIISESLIHMKMLEKG